MKEHLTARPTLIKVQSKTGDIQDFDGLYNVLTVDTIIPLSLKRTTDASGKNIVKFSVGSYPDISQPVLLSTTTNFFKLFTALLCLFSSPLQDNLKHSNLSVWGNGGGFHGGVELSEALHWLWSQAYLKKSYLI